MVVAWLAFLLRRSCLTCCIMQDSKVLRSFLRNLALPSLSPRWPARWVRSAGRAWGLHRAATSMGENPRLFCFSMTSVEGIATIYPPGGEDWQGCNHLHHAVLTSTLADLLPGQMPATEVMEKQNRRGFSPIEVAALCNPRALPALLTHLAGQRGDKEGRAKFLRKLLKTLESCMMQHVKHDLLKRNASHATTI